MKQLLNATLSKVCIFWNIILRYWDPYFCCYLRFHAYCAVVVGIIVAILVAVMATPRGGCI